MPLLHQEEIKRKRERGKYTGSKIGKLVRRENQNSRQNKGVGEREKKEKNREKENEEEEEEETKGPGQGYRRHDTRNSDKKRSPRASLPEDS